MSRLIITTILFFVLPLIAYAQNGNESPKTYTNPAMNAADPCVLRKPTGEAVKPNSIYTSISLEIDIGEIGRLC